MKRAYYVCQLIKGIALGGIGLLILAACSQSEESYIKTMTIDYLNTTDINKRLEIHKEVHAYLIKQHQLLGNESLEEIERFNQKYCIDVIKSDHDLNIKVQEAFKGKSKILPCMIVPDELIELIYTFS